MWLLESWNAWPMGKGVISMNGEGVCGGGLMYVSWCFDSALGLGSGLGSGAAGGR